MQCLCWLWTTRPSIAAFSRHFFLPVKWTEDGVSHANIINNPHAVKLSIKRTLLDLYVQEWHNRFTESSKARHYSCFKYDICLEEYLKTLPRKFYLPICKFRTNNHKLPVETGRWENIPLNDRKCTFCTRDIGDEFHYLFRCSHFSTERSTFLNPIFILVPIS